MGAIKLFAYITEKKIVDVNVNVKFWSFESYVVLERKL